MTEIPDAEEPLTLRAAQTDEERAAVVTDIKRLARELREEIGGADERLSIAHGDLLNGDHIARHAGNVIAGTV